MKATLEVPEHLLRQARATADLRGKSLEELATEALRAHLRDRVGEASPARGWRSVFGRAQPEDVAEIDRIIAEELEHVNLDARR